MNAIVPAPKPQLLATMAERYLLEPDQFAKTVRATCGMATATPEQFAAFLIVAKTYDLNPVTREIYAFPSKGGGIVPIVSIDGWLNLVNSNPQCDGFEFEMTHDAQNGLIACTCKMYRKDRKFPVTVTEYLSECKRATDPWKMEHRMLRHKSLIQAARYAFGFAGIYDEDEGRAIADAIDVTPAARPRVPSPDEVEQIEHQPQGREEHPDHGTDKYRPGDEVKTDQISTGPIHVEKSTHPVGGKKSTLPDVDKDYEGFVSLAIMRMAEIEDGGALESFWNDEIATFEKALMPPDWDDLVDAYTKQQAKLGADE